MTPRRRLRQRGVSLWICRALEIHPFPRFRRTQSVGLIPTGRDLQLVRTRPGGSSSSSFFKVTRMFPAGGAAPIKARGSGPLSQSGSVWLEKAAFPLQENDPPLRSPSVVPVRPCSSRAAGGCVSSLADRSSPLDTVAMPPKIPPDRAFSQSTFSRRMPTCAAESNTRPDRSWRPGSRGPWPCRTSSPFWPPGFGPRTLRAALNRPPR